MINKIYKIITYILIVSVVLFLSIPLLMLVLKGMGTIGVSLNNKETLFAIKLSFYTATISTIICLIFSIPISYYLARTKTKLSKIIALIIYIPMSLPHIISGIALLLFLGHNGIGKYLKQIGLDFVFTKKGIVVAQVFVNMPYMIKILKDSLEKSSEKMEFIGRTLGCSRFQAIKLITIPMIRKDILSSTIITWSRSLGEFGAVVMLAGATSMKTEVLSTSIFLNISTGDLDIALGISTILIGISLLATGIFEYLNKLELEKD